MDKQTPKNRTKKEHILQSAKTLFVAHGEAKVSMDEIALNATVSKVTIYKYFGSKEALYLEVVNQEMEEILIAMESLFNSDADFFGKLKFALLTQLNSLQWVNWNYLFEIWERDGQINGGNPGGVQRRVTTVIETLLEEGKAQGFIDATLSIETILLYADIFRVGLRTKAKEIPSLLTDKATLEKLIHLYFWGLIKQQ